MTQPDRPPIYVRAYEGKIADAMALFQKDAAHMAQGGYYPVAQSYAQGSWGSGAYILGLVLTFAFGIDLLILAYLIIVKPAGTRRSPTSSRPEPSRLAASPSPLRDPLPGRRPEVGRPLIQPAPPTLGLPSGEPVVSLLLAQPGLGDQARAVAGATGFGKAFRVSSTGHEAMMG